MSAPSDCGENREGRSGWDTWAGGSEQRRVGGLLRGKHGTLSTCGTMGRHLPQLCPEAQRQLTLSPF